MKLMHFSAVPVAVAVLLAACVAPPPRVVRVPGPPPPPPQRVFVYPANGQSLEQTERDRYECHVWAVQQTGVDPSRAGANAYERVVVQPANPPGSGTVAGLIGGAIVGSIIGGPRNAGAGAIIGGRSRRPASGPRRGVAEAVPSRGRGHEFPAVGPELGRRDGRHSTAADRDWTAVTITAATPRPGVPFIAHCRTAIAPTIAAGA